MAINTDWIYKRYSFLKFHESPSDGPQKRCGVFVMLGNGVNNSFKISGLGLTGELFDYFLDSTVRCHILNVDMVTMFNPEVVDTLNRMVEDCGACMDRMASQVRETES